MHDDLEYAIGLIAASTVGIKADAACLSITDPARRWETLQRLQREAVRLDSAIAKVREHLKAEAVAGLTPMDE